MMSEIPERIYLLWCDGDVYWCIDPVAEEEEGERNIEYVRNRVGMVGSTTIVTELLGDDVVLPDEIYELCEDVDGITEPYNPTVCHCDICQRIGPAVRTLIEERRELTNLLQKITAYLDAGNCNDPFERELLLVRAMMLIRKVGE